jgi:hypothetical protein
MMTPCRFPALYAGAVTPPEGDESAAADQSLAAAFGATPAATKPGTAMRPDGPDGGASAASTPAAAVTPAAAAGPAGKRNLAQRALDRVPLKWLSTAALVVFLGITSLFGGLEAVAAPETPVVAAGETVVGAEIEMTPVQATLIDELNRTGVFPDEGERIFSVVMDVRNLSEFARSSASTDALGLVSVEGLAELLSDSGLTDLEVQSAVKPVVARLDDGTFSPWLQPGLPVRVVLSWAIPADAFLDGDTVRVSLPTATRSIGQSVIYGVYWSDQRTVAYTDIAIEDLGTGAES